jgi:hypothetical protein
MLIQEENLDLSGHMQHPSHLLRRADERLSLDNILQVGNPQWITEMGIFSTHIYLVFICSSCRYLLYMIFASTEDHINFCDLQSVNGEMIQHLNVK